jgi:hypothetical protein
MEKKKQNITKSEWIGYSGMLMTAISLILLGNTNIFGWVVAISGGLMWISYGITLKLYPIIGINILLIFIDIRGMIIWLH